MTLEPTLHQKTSDIFHLPLTFKLLHLFEYKALVLFPDYYHE